MLYIYFGCFQIFNILWQLYMILLDIYYMIYSILYDKLVYKYHISDYFHRVLSKEYIYSSKSKSTNYFQAPSTHHPISMKIDLIYISTSRD